MSRYFRDLSDAWRQYRLVHTISSRVAGLSLLAFCCACFWMVFQRAEPTTVALALLAFMSACGMFLTAGQRGLEAWTRRNDGSQPSYQQAAPAIAAPAACDAEDPPVNPASQDGEEDKT